MEEHWLLLGTGSRMCHCENSTCLQAQTVAELVIDHWKQSVNLVLESAHEKYEQNLGMIPGPLLLCA